MRHREARPRSRRHRSPGIRASRPIRAPRRAGPSRATRHRAMGRAPTPRRATRRRQPTRGRRPTRDRGSPRTRTAGATGARRKEARSRSKRRRSPTSPSRRSRRTIRAAPATRSLSGTRTTSRPAGHPAAGLWDFPVARKAAGRVLHFGNGALGETVLDLPVNFANERGLLGIAADPRFDFYDGQYVYVYYTESSTGADSSDPASAPLGNR